MKPFDVECPYTVRILLQYSHLLSTTKNLKETLLPIKFSSSYTNNLRQDLSSNLSFFLVFCTWSMLLWNGWISDPHWPAYYLYVKTIFILLGFQCMCSTCRLPNVKTLLYANPCEELMRFHVVVYAERTSIPILKLLSSTLFQVCSLLQPNTKLCHTLSIMCLYLVLEWVRLILVTMEGFPPRMILTLSWKRKLIKWVLAYDCHRHTNPGLGQSTDDGAMNLELEATRLETREVRSAETRNLRR